MWRRVCSRQARVAKCEMCLTNWWQGFVSRSMCQLIFTKATWAPDEELLDVTKGLQEISAKTRWSQDVFVNVDRIPLVDLWVQHGVLLLVLSCSSSRVRRSWWQGLWCRKIFLSLTATRRMKLKCSTRWSLWMWQRPGRACGRHRQG